MSVQKISSFKTFTELKGQQTAAKLHEEGKARRAEIVSKIGAALEEMGVTSLQELDEEKRNSLIAKIFNEDKAEDIEKKIVAMGKPEEEDPEKGANLTNESVINEGTRSQIGKIDKSGKMTVSDSMPRSLYISYIEALSEDELAEYSTQYVLRASFSKDNNHGFLEPGSKAVITNYEETSVFD